LRSLSFAKDDLMILSFFDHRPHQNHDGKAGFSNTQQTYLNSCIRILQHIAALQQHPKIVVLGSHTTMHKKEHDMYSLQRHSLMHFLMHHVHLSKLHVLELFLPWYFTQLHEQFTTTLARKEVQEVHERQVRKLCERIAALISEDHPQYHMVVILDNLSMSDVWLVRGWRGIVAFPLELISNRLKPLLHSSEVKVSYMKVSYM